MDFYIPTFTVLWNLVAQLLGAVLRSRAVLLAVTVLFSLHAHAGTHAVGSPTAGATTWSTICTGCHGVAPTYTDPGDASFSATFEASWGSSGPNNTLAYYAASPSNISAGISALVTIHGTPPNMGLPTDSVTPSYAYTAVTNQNDLSAFFATWKAPVLNTPTGGTFASAATHSGTISSTTGQDYLVSTTTYTATLGTSVGGVYGTLVSTFTVTNMGSYATYSGALPTVSAPTTYKVRLTAKNSNNAATTSVEYSITVNPPAPVISSGTTASGTVGVNATLYTISASNSPTSYGLFSGTLPPGTTLSGANISGTPTTAGSYPVTLSATNVTGTGYRNVTFTIAPGSQTISFGTAPTVVVGGTGTLSATGGASSSPVVYSVPVTTSICSVSGNTVTGLAAGTCTVAANQAADANYNQAAQVTQNITIGKGSQTITFGTAPTVVVDGTGTLNATGGASSNPVVYSVPLTTGICSVSGNTVTGLAAGTCTVAANQTSDANYNQAAQVTQNITIGKGSQVITFGVAPSVVVGGTATVSATGGASTNPVVFSVPTTTSICSISGNTVTGLAAGTCTVAANQATDANYNPAAQVTQNIAVGLTAQTITFGAAPVITYPNTGSVSASTTSGLPLTLSSLTGGVCSISGTTVTSLSAGSCTIAANQAGNGTYASATQTTQTFTIAQAAQSISFGAAPTVAVGGTGTVTATGGASGNAVTYSSLTGAVCSVSGSTVSGLTAGTCTIAANQGSNTNYAAASQATLSFNIGKANQTISFGAAPAIAFGGTGNVTATASSTLAVSFSSLTPGVCTVSGSTISAVAAGTCTIAANQGGNANYNPASQTTLSFSVGKAGQTLSFGAVPSIIVGGTGSVLATSTAGLTPSYSSTTPNVCTVSGSTVTGVSVGTCSIAANQAGNADFNPATQVLQSFGIGQGGQSITFGSAPAIEVGGTGTVSATASSGLAVSFSSLTTSICSISGNTVTGIVAGTCTIAADQAGNANYSAATQATQNITISNLPPVPSAASMSTTLNTAVTFDLAGSITGTGVSGISVVTQPSHGQLSVAGTQVTYTPAHDYFGSDGFSYRAHGLVGASTSTADVTITITGRPDPLNDNRVTGLTNVENAAVKRFGKAQIFNFQQRLESRHHVQMAARVASSPTATSSAPPADARTRGYFNSWQPDQAMRYANDPATLLNAPDVANNSSAPSPAPLSAMVASLATGLLSDYSMNLATVSNAVGLKADEEERVEVWAAGNLRFGTRTQSGVDTRFSTDGMSIGADKRLNSQLTVGMGIGYAQDKSDIGTDGTNSKSTGNSVAAYASYLLGTGGFIDGLLGYGKVNFDTNRYVAPINDFAHAARKGEQVFGSLSFGYEYQNDAISWAPYGRFDFSYDRLKEGSETGAGANALYYADQTARNAQMSLGMRAQSVHQASFGLVQPSVRMEYQHGIETTGQTTIAYADLMGTRYGIAATTQNTNSLVLGLGSEFLLSDTLRFSVDYQHLNSAGHENYQSFNFRLTKDLKGKNDFDYLLGESQVGAAQRPSGWTVASGIAYDDNVSRASASSNVLSDTIYSLTVSKNKSYPLTANSRVTVNAFLDIEKFRKYTGLGHVSAGMKGEYKYRYSGDFGAPTYGVFASLAADEYESVLRDGSRASVGVTLRKPMTDRINLYTALAGNARHGKSSVFDTRDTSIRANVDYTLTQHQTLYLTGEYRRGDIVSSGQSSLAILDISSVLVRDDVFTSPWFYDYRMKGKTALWTTGYNLSFGPKDSLDLSWRRVVSRPDDSPSFAAPEIRYTVNQYAISYLLAF